MMIPGAKNTTRRRAQLLEVKERQVTDATREKRSSSHNLMVEHGGEIVQLRKHEGRRGDFGVPGSKGPEEISSCWLQTL